jgi:capsule polysaccharide export protein KpsC/LpsZ
MNVQSLTQPIASTLDLSSESVALTLGILAGGFLGYLLGRFVKFSVHKNHPHFNSPATSDGAIFSHTFSTSRVNNFSLVVNGQKIELDPQTMSQFRNLLNAGNTSQAALLLQQHCSLDYNQAKNLADSLAQTQL